LERAKMPLTEHLSELRRRILTSLAAVFVIFVVVFNYSEKLFELITFPLRAELRFRAVAPYIEVVRKTAAPLVFLAPAEAFWMHLKVSLVAALILSLPVIFFQLWRFISPGLLEKERKYVMPFVFFATLLFLIGAFFCFGIVLPFAITFLLGYKTQNMAPMLSVGSYVDFCLKFILAFGVIFELPLAIIFLTRIGIVTPKTLAKNRKFAVLFAFIAGAVLTPTPDVFNQTLMAVPIIILYEIGILVSRVMYRKRAHA
jgi:sec-independent protein translocase protein TatC